MKHLLKKIENTFPKLDTGKEFYPRRLNRQDHHEIRELIMSCESKHLPALMGLILYDIALNKDSDFDSTTSFFLHFLNAKSRKSPSITKALSIEELRGEQFKIFTYAQVLVIIEWLLLAKSWPVYVGAHLTIDETLKFWRNME